MNKLPKGFIEVTESYEYRKGGEIVRKPYTYSMNINRISAILKKGDAGFCRVEFDDFHFMDVEETYEEILAKIKEAQGDE